MVLLDNIGDMLLSNLSEYRGMILRDVSKPGVIFGLKKRTGRQRRFQRRVPSDVLPTGSGSLFGAKIESRLGTAEITFLSTPSGLRATYVQYYTSQNYALSNALDE